MAEIVAEVAKAGGTSARLCYQCGKCDVVCPWNRVRDFSIRRIVRQASLGVPEIELEDMWRCTTCGTCPTACPRGVGQVEVGVSLRRIAAEYGVYAGSAEALSGIEASLSSEGNPLGGPRQARGAWAEGLPVRPFEEGMEVLLFVGCYYSYDPRVKKVASAMVRVLDRAGVSFGTLGARETCCGESIRKAGNEGLFRKLARENIKAFVDAGVRRILVASPHCLHTFRNEYPEFMVHFEVVHLSQLLAELVRDGRLKLDGAWAGRVTYHDPCYLGRHNGVYDEPRDVLRSLPGLDFVELPERRERSLCCGGGGGRIWMETPMEERFSDIRLRQALDVGAEVLVTSCPYCVSNFEASRLTVEGGEAVRVVDLVELVHEGIAVGA
jgi:Fe-S oxidoreductase